MINKKEEEEKEKVEKEEDNNIKGYIKYQKLKPKK